MKIAIRKTLFLVAAALLGAAHNSQAGVTCTWLYDLTVFSDATLVQGSNGMLYGTTIGLGAGPNNPYGTLFYAVTNGPSDTYLSGPGLTNLWVFPSNGTLLNNGEAPNAGVILGPNRTTIGTTTIGGTSNTLFPSGMGCIYGFQSNMYALLHYHFGSTTNSHGQPLDGANPRSKPAVASNDYLYVTTYGGGSNGYSGNGLGYGTVFKIFTNGFYYAGLHSFAGTDGANPTGITFGSDGNLYGVTSFGGSNTTVVETNGKTGFGVIYKMTTNGALTVLHSFGALTNAAGDALDGSQPNPLLQGTGGNFYGTTAYGGSNLTVVTSSNDIGYGTFFQITTNGAFTPLYSFGSVTNAAGVPLDGGNPSGPLVEGMDGNFYGVTQFGGPTNTGTVYRMTPQGALTTLHTFGTNRLSKYPILPPLQFQTGIYPRGGLLIAADNCFYGTTYTGGGAAGDTGSIYRLGPVVPAFSNMPANVTIPAGATNIYLPKVYSIYATSCQWQFDGTNLADGGNISGSATSNLTISAATLADSGTYTLVASNVAGSASASGVVTVVPAVITAQPKGATIPAGATCVFTVGVSNFYPATYQWQVNGTNLSDGGEFSGSASSTLTISGAMIADSGSYSVVVSNSAGAVSSGSGMLQVVPFLTVSTPASLSIIAGSTANFVLALQDDEPVTYQWQFNGSNLSDGGNVTGSSTSNLTLTAVTAADTGTYSLIASNGAGSTNCTAFLTVLNPISAGCGLSAIYSFQGADDSGNPETALVEGADGNFYGTTRLGYGIVFRVSSGGAFSNLYAFGQIANDGIIPTAALIQGTDGNFYGTSSAGGGNFDNGTAYKMTPDGVETVLLSVPDSSGSMQAGLVQGADGTLYGGDTGGDVFQLTVGGAYSGFASLQSGHGLAATMVFGSDGNLYGVTSTGGALLDGSVFQASTNGTLQTLYSFTGGNDGENPDASLVRGADGAFYGSTTASGMHGAGTLFRITTNGSFATFYEFGSVTNWDGSPLDGAVPNGLLMAGDGNFYGTTYSGGYLSQGTVFGITPGGALTTLVYFDGTNGANPAAGLVEGSDGALYGTTANGGSGNMGTVFRLTVPPGIRAISQANGVISFSCSALVGQSYQVQCTSCLNPPVWQNLGDPIQATSSCLTITDAIGPQQCFYRVVMLPGQ